MDSALIIVSCLQCAFIAPIFVSSPRGAVILLLIEVYIELVCLEVSTCAKKLHSSVDSSIATVWIQDASLIKSVTYFINGWPTPVFE